MKRVALLAIAMAASFLLCACATPNAPVKIETGSAEFTEFILDQQVMPSPPLQEDGYAPLSIVRGVQSYGDGYIVYPKVLYCTYAEDINASMLGATAKRAEQVSGSVFTKYRIEYNRNGLFSLRMDLYNLYGDANECLETIYMTYNVATGAMCTINDLFDGDDERWRGVMPDIITAQAQAKGITLLCDVMPITNSQRFFIAEDEVVLVYELYEIATWSAGEPEFTIPISQLAEFIPEDSPLAKVALADALANASGQVLAVDEAKTLGTTEFTLDIMEESETIAQAEETPEPKLIDVDVQEDTP